MVRYGRHCVPSMVNWAVKSDCDTLILMTRRLKSRAGVPAAPAESTRSESPKRRKRRHIGTLDLRRQVCKLTDDQLAYQAMMRIAENARGSISDFYELVIRHEITKEVLVPAPHQKVMFSFVEQHMRCVFRLPVGMGKSFGMAAVTLWLIGNDVTQRGAIVSRTQKQAAKILKMVADYITEPSLNKPLIFAFPHLQRSPRINDAWAVNELTVKRPPGIRDPTLAAIGLEVAIEGARLSWVVADDTLSIDNTSTPEVRAKARIKFEGSILARLDPRGSRAVFTNTPWDRDDLTYYLEEEACWPTIQMDIYGNIRISNADAEWMAMAEREYLRPSTEDPTAFRLIAHDPDPDEQVPLWPERMNREEIEAVRKHMMPHEFARTLLCEPFDADAARCHKSWIEKCKQRGIGTTLVHSYDGENLVFTGVDLGIGNKGKHDKTVFFTFELLEDESRRLLNIESGRFSGPRIIEMIDDMHRRYGGVVVVENNSAQEYILQFADPVTNPNSKNKALIIKAHTTTKVNKTHEEYGIESIFQEMHNGAWIIPCDRNGDVEPEVNKWIRNMLEYMPHKHTGDFLVACWIARERARRYGHNDPPSKPGKLSSWAAASLGGGF